MNFINPGKESVGQAARRAAFKEEWQHLSVVSALADLGADRAAKDCLGNTPLDIAQMSGEYRMGAYTDVSRQIVACLEAPPHNA